MPFNRPLQSDQENEIDPVFIDGGNIEIIPHGDVYLDVPNKHDDPKTTVKLLVSSSVLSSASAVFEKMFYSNFKESVERRGSTKAAKRPSVVPLPEDIAFTMWVICLVLHHKSRQIPELGGLDTLLEIAQAADKYQCCEALSPWAENILLNMPYRMDQVNAYFNCSLMLDCPKSFSWIVWSHILHHRGPFIDSGSLEVQVASFDTYKFVGMCNQLFQLRHMSPNLANRIGS
jgi:hypothetical protein